MEALQVGGMTKHPGTAAFAGSPAGLEALNALKVSNSLFGETTLMRGRQDGMMTPSIVRQPGGANPQFRERLIRPAVSRARPSTE